MKRQSQKERSAFYSAICDTNKDGAQHQTTELNNKNIDVRTTFDFLSTFNTPNSSLKTVIEIKKREIRLIY